MALNRGLRIGVGGKAAKVTALYVGVEGKAKKVKKVYVGVGGKAIKVWPAIDTEAKVTGHPFNIGFTTLDQVNASGVWNTAEARIEY